MKPSPAKTSPIVAERDGPLSSDAAAPAGRSPARGTAGADGAAEAPLIAVVGPTASGKSALALAVAEAVGGEIVSTDAVQVYRGLDVGTAKPTAAERERVPHHLLDVVAPDEPYSAGRFVAAARAALADIAARGRTPILCGGTGLYYRALVFGLAEIPPVPDAVLAAVEAELAAEGLSAAHAALHAVDPAAAARIGATDPQRIARALAVHRATGRPLSAYQAAQPFRQGAPEMLVIGPAWERPALYARIDARVRAMLADGWLEEVERLLAAGVPPACRAMRSIGYRELVAYLQHGGNLSAVEQAIAQRTRRYAKRQLTWFRRHPEVHWAPPGESARLLAQARNYLLRHGGGG